ncbi:MAG: hypothetical protein MJE68_22505, partial [Proteobacteria bacterium]|nr:hypothetical protein [Pseudomonadota bacterium]
DGSLAKVPVQQQPPPSMHFNPSNLNLNPGNVLPGQTIPTPEIKQENSSSGSRGLSIDDFNSFGNHKTIGSPLNKTPKRTMGAGRGNTPKKQKTVSNTELYSSLAELKRECIREVNALLKTFKPANDPNVVIWTEVNRLNRGIVVGPKSPHSFLKNIANCYPELKNLTDEEKVANLLKMASRFVAENLTWMEVNRTFCLSFIS